MVPVGSLIASVVSNKHSSRNCCDLGADENRIGRRASTC